MEGTECEVFSLNTAITLDLLCHHLHCLLENLGPDGW